MGLIAKLRSLFGKGRPQAPKLEITGGHRGIAAGSLKERHRRMAAGEQAYTPEEVEKWRNVTKDDAEAFVYEGKPLFTVSSNVAMIQFYPDTNQMQVEFNSGASYLYEQVSVQDALAAIQLQSKGRFVWEYLRHTNKPYKRLK